MKDSVGVFFPCTEALDGLPTGVSHPRNFDEEKPVPAVSRALNELSRGPNAAEKRQGYVWPLATGKESAPTDVRLEGGMLIVDYPATLAAAPGALESSAGAISFLYAVRSTVFQFEEFQGLRLTIAGDCEAFWNLVQGSCHDIERGDAQ